MRTVLLASLRHHTRRYVASALAVVIGVGFIVATEGLAGALRDGMTADLGRPYAGAERVVTAFPEERADDLIQLAAEKDVAAEPLVVGWASARASNGSAVDVRLGAVALTERFRWQEVTRGRAPTGAGELLVDEALAAQEGIEVGEVLTFEGPDGPWAIDVVGFAKAAVGVGADVYLTWPDARTSPDVWATALLWDGPADGVTETVPDAYVETADEHVAALQQDITRGVDVIALLVSVFAAIALGVAILVITNTFAILFAQRARDFALLRCVGVTRRQLRRSVRIEALVLGVTASLAGVLAGVLTAHVLAMVIGWRFEVFGTAAFRPTWIVVAAVVGVAVTLVAAWFPTRAVTKVSPLTALRPFEVAGRGAGVGLLRVLVALVLVVVGVGLLGLAVGHGDAMSALLLMFAGGGASFVGVLVLGPVLVPRVLTVLGRLVTRPGAAGAVPRLATSNAVRNPRRTATTTASLMVGVTLVTAVLTGLGTITRALGDEMAADYPLDQVVVWNEEGELPESVLSAVADADGVDAAAAMRGGVVTLGGADVLVLGLGEGADALRSEIDLPEGTFVLPYSYAADVASRTASRILDGEPVVLRAGDRTVTASGDFDSAFGPTGLVDDATLATLAPGATVRAVWVRAADGTDPGDLRTALARATSGADVTIEGEYAERAWIDSQFTVVTAAVLGLLGVAVLIAVIGIANTLGLSVLERTRENALLRAMGITRRQLRRTLATEGALLASVAALLGTAIGVAFAWVGVQVMLAGLLEAEFRVPVVALLVVLVAAVLSGVVTSVVPARRAARVTPAAGLSAD